MDSIGASVDPLFLYFFTTGKGAFRSRSGVARWRRTWVNVL